MRIERWAGTVHIEMTDDEAKTLLPYVKDIWAWSDHDPKGYEVVAELTAGLDNF